MSELEETIMLVLSISPTHRGVCFAEECLSWRADEAIVKQPWTDLQQGQLCARHLYVALLLHNAAVQLLQRSAMASQIRFHDVTRSSCKLSSSSGWYDSRLDLIQCPTTDVQLGHICE